MPKTFTLSPVQESQFASLEAEAKTILPLNEKGKIMHKNGLWQHISDLYAAIMARDISAMWLAARDLIDHFMGEETDQLKGAALDWTKLRDFVLKILTFILPLILEKQPA